MSGKPDLTHKIRLKNPVCIGIGGVSRSGKTFLSGLLADKIADIVIIHQDTYIPKESEIPTIKNHTDWERPEAIDWHYFRQAIETAILSGKSVIVEGLFAFHNKEINKLYHKAVFISLSRDEFLRRKRTDLRWGPEPEWYINHIWESHMIYGRLPGDIANPLLINGAQDFDPSHVIAYLQS